MHLMALTKRSAFYIEEKRHIEERHISPVHLIVLITEPDIIPAEHRETDCTLLAKASSWT